MVREKHAGPYSRVPGLLVAPRVIYLSPLSECESGPTKKGEEVSHLSAPMSSIPTVPFSLAFACGSYLLLRLAVSSFRPLDRHDTVIECVLAWFVVPARIFGNLGKRSQR